MTRAAPIGECEYIMKYHDGSLAWALRAPSFFGKAALALLLACAMFGLTATVALGAPAPPVATGPTAIQFAAHPAGFRATITWDPVPTAVSYQIYNADTLFYVGSVTDTDALIYGMQNVAYHHYVIAVDSLGATSTPSNVVDILTSAPAPAPAPVGFAVLPTSVFELQSASVAPGDLPIKLPYEPALVTGDAADLRLMRYVDGAWVDITVSVDTTRSLVSGLAPATSVFAVMDPTGVPTVEPNPITIVTSMRFFGPSILRLRSTTVYRGTLLPASAPGTISVTRQRWMDGVWRSEGTTVVSVSSGEFDYVFRPARRGLWRLAGSYAGAVDGPTTYTPADAWTRTIVVR